MFLARRSPPRLPVVDNLIFELSDDFPSISLLDSSQRGLEILDPLIESQSHFITPNDIPFTVQATFLAFSVGTSLAIHMIGLSNLDLLACGTFFWSFQRFIFSVFFSPLDFFVAFETEPCCGQRQNFPRLSRSLVMFEFEFVLVGLLASCFSGHFGMGSSMFFGSAGRGEVVDGSFLSSSSGTTIILVYQCTQIRDTGRLRHPGSIPPHCNNKRIMIFMTFMPILHSKLPLPFQSPSEDEQSTMANVDQRQSTPSHVPKRSAIPKSGEWCDSNTWKNRGATRDKSGELVRESPFALNTGYCLCISTLGHVSRQMISAFHRLWRLEHRPL
mmetsp:Transcript_2273/g.8407  ORF Transcript_2273/g.8407 Transcript_2273/m.8407 type:complete len:329 (+) Transcript_2273:217-1203(+)